MKDAMGKFVVSGINSTIPLYQFMLKNRDYLPGKANTQRVEDVCLRILPNSVNPDKIMIRLCLDEKLALRESLITN